MYPGQFDYVRPDNLDETLRILKDREGEAKLLSGGYSLLPLIKLRLAQPALLVDLQNIAGLDGIAETDDYLRIGARATHRQIHEAPIVEFVAIDDCGNIINPMIVDGQIHGGLTMGLAPALFEEITYDELGNNLAGTFMDYLVPTAVESPAWETGKTITPSPHHPIGAKGVGESATVGAPPAIANAVVDALWHLGVRNVDIPMTPQKIWAILHEKGVA